MDIYASDNELRRVVEDETARKKQYGAEMATKITLRLAALRAAESLRDFWPPKSGPERCHELKGSRAGTFSMDLKQPYRLLFEPHDVPQAADRSNEQQRWHLITAIEITGIEDTHE